MEATTIVEVFPFTNVFIYASDFSFESKMAKRGSEEWKKRISETKRRQYAKGELIPWNKGIPSNEQPFFGKRHSKKTRRKMSESKKGKPKSEETKMKISKTLTGRRDSIETRLKKSRSQMGHRYRGGGTPIGFKHSDETKKKISEKAKGRKHSEETKRKIAIASRKIRLNRSPFPQKDTSIEQTLHDGLQKHGIKHEKHITVCNICQPDIVFSDKKIAVFADGDYWHSKEFKNGTAWKKDRNQDKVLRKNGWIVLRFWGSEIESNPYRCIEKIISEVKECQ